MHEIHNSPGSKTQGLFTTCNSRFFSKYEKISKNPVTKWAPEHRHRLKCSGASSRDDSCHGRMETSAGLNRKRKVGNSGTRKATRDSRVALDSTNCPLTLFLGSSSCQAVRHEWGDTVGLSAALVSTPSFPPRASCASPPLARKWWKAAWSSDAIGGGLCRFYRSNVRATRQRERPLRNPAPSTFSALAVKAVEMS